jgi:molybdenum-dependent DNA-binding transcriptional regulator ModE
MSACIIIGLHGPDIIITSLYGHPRVDIQIQSSQVINGKTVTVRQLEALIAVQDTGSQTSAAKLLGISVPVLHKYISSIEEAAGEPILKTTPAGSVLTPAGREIAEISRAMEFRGQRDRGFTICCSPVTEDIMMSVVSASKIPNAHMIVSDDQYNIRMMRENRADLAIIDDPLYLFDAEEYLMDEIGYMGMVYVDNGPSFIRYKYGAQRVAFMFLDSIGKKYTIESETFSLPELLGSNKSFFIDEFMLTRRNLRLKSAVDPKMLKHAITAIYRDEDPRIMRILKAVKARNL